LRAIRRARHRWKAVGRGRNSDCPSKAMTRRRLRSNASEKVFLSGKTQRGVGQWKRKLVSGRSQSRRACKNRALNSTRAAAEQRDALQTQKGETNRWFKKEINRKALNPPSQRKQCPAAPGGGPLLEQPLRDRWKRVSPKGELKDKCPPTRSRDYRQQVLGGFFDHLAISHQEPDCDKRGKEGKEYEARGEGTGPGPRR